MNIECWFLGGKHDEHIKPLIEEYSKKIKNYHPKISFSIIAEDKSSVHEVALHQKKNAELILKKIKPTDFLVLLDEGGKMFSSVALSSQLQQWILSSQTCVFCVGGAYGFHHTLKERANFVWSFSPLTFPHQLARLILLEQMYRSFAILHGHPYHHV